jgi:spore coat protein U-like protein
MAKFNGVRAAMRVATAGLMIGVPSAALAGTAVGSIGVSATVSSSCSVTGNAVNFGAVAPLSGSNFDASGSIVVTCTNGTAWTASAAAGNGTGATVAARKMTATPNVLSYNLYIDSGHATVWGDGTLSTSTISGTGTGTAQTTTIYGRVPLGQTSVPAGSYSDSVSVTITY